MPCCDVQQDLTTGICSNRGEEPVIAYVEGRLAHVSEAAIIVVTDGGVGYEVEVTARTRQGLPDTGGRVALFTTLLVREDMLRLCGFETIEERSTFELLTSIPKVGPKLSLAILSLYRPAELRRIVAEADVTALTAVSGVGKRLGETVCRELAYKFKMEESAQMAADRGAVGTVYHSVLDGLKGLGYSENECAPVLQDILRAQPDLDVASALRAALQELGRTRT